MTSIFKHLFDQRKLTEKIMAKSGFSPLRNPQKLHSLSKRIKNYLSRKNSNTGAKTAVLKG